MTECPEHGLYHEYHERCPHRHCGDDRPDADHESCVAGRSGEGYDGEVSVRTGRGYVSVDPCIASIVQALNEHDRIPTSASCCGHGKAPGWIALSDGRCLVVVADRDEALRMQFATRCGRCGDGGHRSSECSRVAGDRKCGECERALFSKHAPDCSSKMRMVTLADLHLPLWRSAKLIQEMP